MTNRYLSSREFRLWPLVLLLLAVSGPSIFAVRAQEQDTGRQKGGGASSVIIASRDDYVIGISDVLDIQVDKAPELSGNFRVGSKGTIPMPYLGPVACEGRTPEQLGRYIADRLRGPYLKDPIVTVSVRQYNSRSFFVQGSVKSPGVYYIDGSISLFKLISIAGGLDKDHGSTAFIIREVQKREAREHQVSDGGQPAGPATDRPEPASLRENQNQVPEQYELIAVNLTALLRGNFDKNVVLQPGDQVNIPQTDVFFVSGEVNAPGQFPLKPGTTLRQAISLAQGTKFSAAKGRSVIFRENQTSGAQEEVKVDIGAVMEGKSPDVPIKANDVVIVPHSTMKAAGGALLKAFGLSVTSIRYY